MIYVLCLADWILEKVENGVFIDPSEAVFYLLQEVKELEPHHDLRKQLLQRKLDEAQKGPFIDGEKVFHNLKEQLEKTPSLPVKWIKIDQSNE